MAYDVGECLGGDAVRRDLQCGRQGRQAVGGDGDVDGGAVRAERQLVGSLPERSDEAELVQRGRSQVVDKPTDVADGSPRVRPQPRQKLDSLRGAGGGGAGGVGGGRRGCVVRDQVGDCVSREGDAGEGGAQAVVEVSAEAAAFFFAG